MIHRKTLYLVVEAEGSELPVFCGTVEEVAEFLGCHVASIYTKVSRQTKVQKKYHIVEAHVWEDEFGRLYDWQRGL